MNLEQNIMIKFAIHNGEKLIEIRSSPEENRGDLAFSETQVHSSVNELTNG
jgi:hypothetical protein